MKRGGPAGCARRLLCVQLILTAKANAEAIRSQTEALTKQGGIEYVQLQAIAQWDGKLPQYSGSGAVPFLNTGK